MGSPCPVKSRGSSRAPFTSRETTVMPPGVLPALESSIFGFDFTFGLNTCPHLSCAQAGPFLIPIK